MRYVTGQAETLRFAQRDVGREPLRVGEGLSALKADG
jgi:hypothetical protein